LWHLFFGIVGTYKKNRNCGNLSKKSKKIGIMGTYLYLKIRNCGNLFKKSELWEHIYISTLQNCGNMCNRNCGTCHSELWDPSKKSFELLKKKNRNCGNLFRSYVNISKILRFGIVGTSENNRSYGNISIF
jgi:hypothetical protein